MMGLRRLIALLLILPSLIANPSIVQAVPARPAVRRMASQFGLFSLEALALPLAASSGQNVLSDGDRRRQVFRAVRNDEADSAFAIYSTAHEALKAALRDVAAEGKGFFVPLKSFARKAFDHQGRARPFGALGVVWTPPEDVKQELMAVRKKFLEKLREVVGNQYHGEDVEVEFKRVLENLVALPEDTFHVTWAGKHIGGRWFVRLKYRFKRWSLDRLTMRITKFHRAFSLLFKGEIAFLQPLTSCIAAILEFRSSTALNQAQSLRTAFANRLAWRTEVMHLSLWYVIGRELKRNPETKKMQWWVSPEHMSWISAALELAETALQRESDWPVNSVAVLAVKSFGETSGHSKNYPLVLPEDHDNRQKRGIKLLVQAMQEAYTSADKAGKAQFAKMGWIIRGPEDLDETSDDLEVHKRLTQLDSLRGIFHDYHLRNLNELFVAMGSAPTGEADVSDRDWIPAKRVADLLTHGSKLKAKVIPGADGSPHKLEIDADHDHPGLSEAVSRALDSSGHYVISLKQDNSVSWKDFVRGVRVSFEAILEGISWSELGELCAVVQAIPDIGHTTGVPILFRYLVRVLLAILKWLVEPLRNIYKEMRPVSLRIILPPRERVPNQPSRRTKVFEALRKVSPDCDVTELTLIRPPESGPIIYVTVLMPRAISLSRIAETLSADVGIPTENITRVRNRDKLSLLQFNGTEWPRVSPEVSIILINVSDLDQRIHLLPAYDHGEATLHPERVKLSEEAITWVLLHPSRESVSQALVRLRAIWPNNRYAPNEYDYFAAKLQKQAA